jgi:hypothetical protein
LRQKVGFVFPHLGVMQLPISHVLFRFAGFYVGPVKKRFFVALDSRERDHRFLALVFIQKFQADELVAELIKSIPQLAAE